MAKSSVIGALRVHLGLDSTQFQTGLKNASKSLDGMVKKAEAFGKAAGLAITAAAGAISIAVGNVINRADKLGDVADRLGVSVEALQELRHAADRAGMGMDNFDVALRRFIRRSAEAAQGTGAAKGAFEELGISLRDSEGRLKSSEALLSEVADAMQKVPNQADRLRLAFKMFDTDGAAMVNVLAEGSAGLNRMREEARNLGIVLSNETVRGAQAFKDNIDTISKAKDGLIMKLTAHLLPSLEVLSEKFLGFVNDEAAVTATAQGIGKSFQWIARQAAHLTLLIDRLKVEFTGLAEAVSLAMSGDFSGARAAWSAGQKASARMRDELDATLEQMESGFIHSQGSIQRRISAAFGDAGREAGENFASGLDDATKGSGSRVRATIDEMASDAARIFEQTRTPLERYQATIARLNDLLQAGAINQDTYNRAVVQAQDAFAQAEQAGKKTENVFLSIGQTIAQSFGSAISGIIDGSKKAGDVIRDLMSQLGNMLVSRAFQSLISFIFPGGGGFGGISLHNLPRYANGTGYHPGGLAWVGERGKELVNLPRGSSVTPNHELVKDPGAPSYQDNRVFNVDARGAQEGVAEQITRALRSFSDEVLPGRVNEIAIDPYARG